MIEGKCNHKEPLNGPMHTPSVSGSYGIQTGCQT